MEISGAVVRRSPAFFGVRSLRHSISAAAAPRSVGPSTAAVGKREGALARSRGLSVAFADAGHLNYYASPVRCGGGRSKEEKMRAKLVEGLSKDLAALCSVGFGADAAEGLAGEVKGKTLTDAAEFLMAELKQVRAQEKEMKRKQKKEKKAAKMKCRTAMKDDSSSSSSSSSDSREDECRNEVLRMSDLRTTSGVQELNPETLTIEVSTLKTGQVAEHHTALNPPRECRSNSNSNTLSASIGCCSNVSSTASVVENETPMKKIEVCMGGKCKRSGAVELMEEFSRKIGHEGAVVACKCMGRCRDGPNIRIRCGAVATGAAAAGPPKNPLCIGVGLEDVTAIAANFFGGHDVGLVPA